MIFNFLTWRLSTQEYFGKSLARSGHESGAAALLLLMTDSHIRTPGLFKTECLGKKIIALVCNPLN